MLWVVSAPAILRVKFDPIPSRFSEYPRIERAALAALTLDGVSAKIFERRFSPFILAGMLLGGGCLLIGHLLFRYEMMSGEAAVGLGFAGIIPGLVIAFLAYHRMMRTRPRSAQSGEEMAAFVIRENELPDFFEIAYIDEKSGTYFTRPYGI